MMLDLSTINPNDVEPLREIVRKTRDDQRNSCFTVHWKGDYHCKLFIGKQPEHLLDGLCGAFHTRHGLLMRNYGNKQKNAYYHEAGFAGTLLHEWCHRMQWFCSSNKNDGWYNEVSHLHQDQLYAKWVDICGATYAASSAYEMSAEAFRALKGWRSTEVWEDNQEFLADWRDFFMSDPVFSLLF